MLKPRPNMLRIRNGTDVSKIFLRPNKSRYFATQARQNNCGIVAAALKVKLKIVEDFLSSAKAELANNEDN